MTKNKETNNISEVELNIDDKNTVKEKGKEKVYIVKAPIENFCGVDAAGVQFAYGKAEVHEGWVLEWFKEHGYTVTEK